MEAVIEFFQGFLEKYFSRLTEISSPSELTTGELLFYGGFALAAFTLLLGLIFLIFRPKYRPESATYNINKDKKPKKSKGQDKARDPAATVLTNTRAGGDGRTELMDDPGATRFTGGAQSGATEFAGESPAPGATEFSAGQPDPGATELVDGAPDSGKTEIL